MYIQHRHMICGELHICHDLVLYKNVNGDDYWTPLLHEALDVDHKMVMMGIGWYHNTFSHLCVQYQHYPEHNTLCLSILFYWIFSYISPNQWIHVYECFLDRCFWIFLARLTSFFSVQECIIICESIFLSW